jgi:hypothetical protein
VGARAGAGDDKGNGGEENGEAKEDEAKKGECEGISEGTPRTDGSGVGRARGACTAGGGGVRNIECESVLLRVWNDIPGPGARLLILEVDEGEESGSSLRMQRR